MHTNGEVTYTGPPRLHANGGTTPIKALDSKGVEYGLPLEGRFDAHVISSNIMHAVLMYVFA